MSVLSSKKQEKLYLLLYLLFLILFTGLIVKGFYEVDQYFENPYPTYQNSVTKMNGGLSINLSRFRLGRIIYITGFIGLILCNAIYFYHKRKQKQLKAMRISAIHNLKKNVSIERVAQITQLSISDVIFIRYELDKN
ncbi:hypothetical protein [Haloplasma contractile]|uniref:Uncharacterized protein n=1 Tax=Haloplasma contractile SSD-17B TaxID=1033810 RepID=F7PVR6_9MOLU|nr:hypothetical protein [Haloplasma contractile]ERJ12763.1 hypothetical protein HLPCO_001103 [Haloplasma contractile SSD-17B]